jgi:hypothetical protein
VGEHGCQGRRWVRSSFTNNTAGPQEQLRERDAGGFHRRRRQHGLQRHALKNFGRMADSDTGFDYRVPVPRKHGSRISADVGMPYVSGIGDLDGLPGKLGPTSEFAFALDFNPGLVDAVCERGYFPMSLDFGVPVFAVKVHKERCALMLQVRVQVWTTWSRRGCVFVPFCHGLLLQKHLHIRKTWKKPCKAFTFTANQRFEEVLKMCVADHGENWLFPQIRRAFAHMHRNPAKYKARMLR